MLKQRREAVAAVSAAFLPFEQVLRQAAILGPVCVSAMIKERHNAYVSEDYGNDVIALIRRAEERAHEAFNDVIAAHDLLAAMPDELGVRHLAFGDDESVHNTPRGLIAAPLAIVA